MEDKQLELLLRLADDGDAWAKEQLAAIESGVVNDAYNVLQRCSPQRRDNSEECYARQLREKADKGDAQSQYYLGCDYDLKDNAEKAVKWYRMAAEQGFAEAQFALAEFYYWGWGIECNDAEAAKWYRAAAEQGHGKAQKGLGECYNEGTGVVQDYEEAIKWMQLAAEQGVELAGKRLAVIKEEFEIHSLKQTNDK